MRSAGWVLNAERETSEMYTIVLSKRVVVTVIINWIGSGSRSNWALYSFLLLWYCLLCVFVRRFLVNGACWVFLDLFLGWGGVRAKSRSFSSDWSMDEIYFKVC